MKQADIKFSRELLTLANLGYWKFDAGTGKLVFTEQALDTLGGLESAEYSMEDFLDFCVFDAERRKLKELLKGCLEDQESFRMQFRVLNNDNSFRHIIMTGQFDEAENPFCYYGILQSVEEVVRDADQEEEIKLSHLSQELANVGTWRYSIKKNSLQWSRQIYRIFGLSRDDSPGDFLHQQHLFENTEWKNVRELRENAVRNLQEYRTVARIETLDEPDKWVEEICKIEKTENDEEYLLVGTIQDITKLKQTESILESHRRQLTNLTNSIPGVVLQYRIDSLGQDQILYVSRGCREVWELPEEEALRDPSSVWGQVFREDAILMQNTIAESARTGNFWDHEWRIKTPSGQVKWLNGKGNPLRQSDGSVIWDTIIFDVTEKKQSKLKLEKEKERFQNVIRGTNAGTWEWNIQTGETVFNERWAEIIGYSLEELQPVSIVTWQKYVHPDDLVVSNRELMLHFSGKTDYYECVVRMEHKSGEWVWVMDKGKVNQWTTDGKPLMMYGTHIDISHEKKMEERLAESEARYRALTEGVPVGIVVHDGTNFLFANPYAVKSVEAENESQLLSASPTQLIHPDYVDFARERTKSLLETEKSVLEPAEQKMITFRGNEKDMLMSGIKLVFGNKPAICSVFTEITVQKQTQRQLQEALNEKNVLFKELHHRVKNNLQLVSAILSLQSMDTSSEEIRAFVDETNSRIISVSKIHDHLLKQESIDTLDINKYLRDLIKNILVSNALHPERFFIDTEVAEEKLKIDIGLMLGLIVNETVSNSIKYAYEPTVGGRIEVKLEKSQDLYKLLIRDFGRGFDPRISETRPGSQGLGLIRLFCKQIGADLITKTNGGVSYKIVFSLN